MAQIANGRPVAGAAGVLVGRTTDSVPATGDMPHPAAGWCPPGGCSARLAEQVERAVAFAFQAGRAHERAELAAMEETWKPLARRTWEQAVADRMAQMDRAARTRAEREGRPYRIHPGGPVDWHTGRPLRQTNQIGAAA